jgi:hypothetical protein
VIIEPVGHAETEGLRSPAVSNWFAPRFQHVCSGNTSLL